MTPDDVKAAMTQSLAQGKLRQGQAMVPEVPVGARNEFDVRSESDQLPTRFEAAMNLIDGGSQGFFIREMFEKVAREDDVK